MNQDIQQSILEVARAIEQLNQAFERRADSLRQGGDPKELAEWIKATHAMRDSGEIYLSWARHYARTAGVEAEPADSELGEFLEE